MSIGKTEENFLAIGKEKPSERDEMVEYLSKHYRYHTMNSWNRATSYARCVKVHHLVYPDNETRETAYALLECDETFLSISDKLRDFEANHGKLWGAGFNGRSGGYIVLYTGGHDDRGNVHIYPGRGVDMGEDFNDENAWDLERLKDRVDLVWEFDELVDECIADFIGMAQENYVIEKTVSVPKTIKILKPKAEL